MIGNSFFKTLTALVVIGSGSFAAGPRLPVDLVVMSDGKRLTVANRSGTLSLIDCKTNKVIKEAKVGERLSGMTSGKDNAILVLDDARHQLVKLNPGEHAKDGWETVWTRAVAAYPADVIHDAQSGKIFVSSTWSRTLTILSDDPSRPSLIDKLELKFEPRLLCLSPDRKRLLVAGAFGGQIAVVATTTGQLLAEKHIPGHNIGGIGFLQGKIAIALQQLNPQARSTRDDVHWGNMVSNVVAVYPAESLLSNAAELPRPIFLQIGTPEHGAADPGAMVLFNESSVAILSSGADQLLVREDVWSDSWARIPTGRRPYAMAMTTAGAFYVANTFSDTISVIDPRQPMKTVEIPLGSEKPHRTLAQRGEMLFHDARLSHDGWMSCHSCHTNGHSNGQLNDNLSDSSFGDPKRVLSLLGVSETGPWAWSGEVETLDAQVRSSITNTMQGDEAREDDVKALVAYLRSLAPPPKLGISKPNIANGKKVFARLNCAECHTPPLFTSKRSYDVNLHDSSGRKKFNPPSLRGVSRRSTFFHDSRATSLKQVFLRHHHPRPVNWRQQDLADLIAYLQSL